MWREFRSNRLFSKMLTFPREHRNNDIERLEFIGDKLLNLTVSLMLMETFPNATEGELSIRLANLIDKKALYEIMLSSGIYSAIRFSCYLEKNQMERGVSCILESVIGFLMFRKGDREVMLWIRSLYEDLIHRKLYKNPKSMLQEMLHTHGIKNIRYHLYRIIGEKHNPLFISYVSFRLMGKHFVYPGSGSDKKSSEISAARNAVNALNEFLAIRSLSDRTRTTV